MTHVKRVLAVLFTALVLAGLVPSGTANAASGCQTWVDFNYMATSLCTSGGQYRQAIVCKNWLGWSAYREGPRVSSWQYSRATCPGGYSIRSHWILHY